MPPKKQTQFNPIYENKYGLRISARDPITFAVIAVECRFCVHFGREKKVGAKRKPTENVHFFQSFRADQIRQHHNDQHPEKWNMFQMCTDEEKLSFFFDPVLSTKPENKENQLLVDTHQYNHNHNQTQLNTISNQTEPNKISKQIQSNQVTKKQNNQAAKQTQSNCNNENNENNENNQTNQTNQTNQMNQTNHNMNLIFFENNNQNEVPKKAELSRIRGCSSFLYYSVNRNLVDFLICKMFLNGNENLENEFIDLVDQEETFQLKNFPLQMDCYGITIKNPAEFYFTVECLCIGISLKNTSFLLLSQEKQFHPLYNSNKTVHQYVRFLCSLNYQKILELLSDSSVWAFSLSLAIITYRKMTFIQIRCHIAWKGQLLNLHLISIPFVDKNHTKNIHQFQLEEILDCLCCDWKKRVVGIVVLGNCQQNLSCQQHDLHYKYRKGLQKELQESCFIRTDNIQQFNHLVVNFLSTFLDDPFYSTLFTLTAYLRRQHNLIDQMKTKPPKLENFKWESLYHISSWFKTHRIQIMEYLNLHNPKCQPSNAWWFVLMIVNKILSTMWEILASLQGLWGIQHQNTTFSQLLENLIQQLQIQSVPCNALEKQTRNSNTNNATPPPTTTTNAILYSQDNTLAISIENIHNFVQDLGRFVNDCQNSMEPKECHQIFYGMGHSLLNFLTGIQTTLSFERDCLSSILPVLPHDLVKLRGSQMSCLLQSQKNRLLSKWSTSTIDHIEQEFQQLQTAYQHEDRLKSLLDQSTVGLDFQKGWNCLGNRFPTLRDFCGGLATIYSSPKSDIPDLTFKSNNNNDDDDLNTTSIVDFMSMEGNFHAKQFKQLQNIQIL